MNRSDDYISFYNIYIFTKGKNKIKTNGTVPVVTAKIKLHHHNAQAYNQKQSITNIHHKYNKSLRPCYIYYANN